MGSNLLEGNFNPPAKRELLDHLHWVNRRLSTQQRLGLQLPEWVSDKYPSDGHWDPAPAIPVRSLRAQLNRAGGAIVPSHAYTSPAHGVIVDEVDQ